MRPSQAENIVGRKANKERTVREAEAVMAAAAEREREAAERRAERIESLKATRAELELEAAELTKAWPALRSKLQEVLAFVETDFAPLANRVRSFNARVHHNQLPLEPIDDRRREVFPERDLNGLDDLALTRRKLDAALAALHI